MAEHDHESIPQAIVLSPQRVANLADETFPNPNHGPGLTWKTLTSASKTPTKALSCGIAVCEPGHGRLCTHQHAQVELYHILEGEGILEIDGIEYPVERGSVAQISGNAKHGIRNSSQTMQLRWFYVFAADDFEDVQYRFAHQPEEKQVGS